MPCIIYLYSNGEEAFFCEFDEWKLVDLLDFQSRMNQSMKPEAVDYNYSLF